MFRSLFIQASKKVGIFFSGAARRLEANDYLTKAIQIRELLFLGITFRDHPNAADTLSSLFSFSLLACFPQHAETEFNRM